MIRRITDVYEDTEGLERWISRYFDLATGEELELADILDINR